jgi:urease accessory protein UreH
VQATASSGNLTVDVSAETSEPRPSIRVRRADALGLMAESFLKHSSGEMNGGDRSDIAVDVSRGTSLTVPDFHN